MKEKTKIYTRPMKAQKAGNNDSGSRRKKLMRVFGASALAIIMGIGTLFGVVISPMNSSRASTSGSEENLLTPQEQLLAGTLELDPEKDPVVYTTDYGLDIKFHADWGSFGTVNSSLYDVTGYVYFTMGTYDGTPVNWIIIGIATSGITGQYYDGTHNLGTKYNAYTFTNYVSQTTSKGSYFKNNHYETSSNAGSAISSAGSKGLVYDFAAFTQTFTKAKSNEEIPSGCVLCLSEYILFKAAFNSSSGYANYAASNLKTVMSSLYSTNLGLTTTQKNYIQPQTIYAEYYNGSNFVTTTNTGQFMYPLSSETDGKFYVGDYLDDYWAKAYLLNTTSTEDWWLRDAYGSSYPKYGQIVRDNGSWTSDYPYTYSTYKDGVRPAFVLKI